MTLAMRFMKLAFCLLWAGVSLAQPTTLATPDNTKPTTVKQETTTPELLRQSVHVVPSVHRIRGRVILATSHVQGSDEWGITADEAETSCHRISQIDPTTMASGTFAKPSSLNTTKLPMEGHLISVSSTYEVLALSKLLHPLPDGPFWTGGKIARYRRHNAHDGSFSDHIVLAWNDGRSPDLSVLGMTPEDKLQLKESYIYCLALNLLGNTWQARNCSDKLPYACLVTPKRIGFSNELNARETKEEIPKESTENADVNGELHGNKTQESPAKLMDNVSGQKEDESTSTTEVGTTESQHDSTTMIPESLVDSTSSVLSDAQVTDIVATHEAQTNMEAIGTTLTTPTTESISITEKAEGGIDNDESAE